MTLEELKDSLPHNDEAEIQAYINIVGEKYATVESFEDNYIGEYRDDEAFTIELLDDTEPALKDLPAYIHIDWESTARDIMMDYSKDNGYYFRNI